MPNQSDQKHKPWLHFDMRLNVVHILTIATTLVIVGIAWGNLSARIDSRGPGPGTDATAQVRLAAIERAIEEERRETSEMREDIRLILKYILESRRQVRAD